MTRDEKIKQLKWVIDALERSRETTMAEFEVHSNATERHAHGTLVSFCISNNIAIALVSKAVIKLMEMQDDE